MSSIFDFTNLEKLVKSNKPSVIIVVDTNVVMDNPDFLQWHSDIVNPIFVLTHFTISELAFNIKPKGNQPAGDKVIKARKAIAAFDWLTDQGQPSLGIHFDNIGWLITIPFPDKNQIDPELAKLSYIREINHDTDTALLILHKELICEFSKVPVISLTGDKLYKIFGRDAGLLVYNSQSFPLVIKDWIVSKVPKLHIDPDKVLSEAVQRLEKKSIKVRLTLTGKRLDREYKFESEAGPRYGAIIAEGEGILYHPDLGTVSFIWKLPYKPLTSVNLAKNPDYGEADIYEDHASNFGLTIIPRLNFLGKDQEIPIALRFILMEKLADLATASPDMGLSTLQSPICRIEYFMKTSLAVSCWDDEFGQLSDDERNETEIVDKLFQGMVQAWEDPYAFEDFDAFRDYCINTLCQTSHDNVAAFVDSVLSTWNMGQTIELILPPEDIAAAEQDINSDT